jgi:putative Mn2+ efflux pump MntP
MNISATLLLAFGMSMDAFAASIGKGASLHKPKFSEALRTGLIFGAIETLTTAHRLGSWYAGKPVHTGVEPLDRFRAARISGGANGD